MFNRRRRRYYSLGRRKKKRKPSLWRTLVTISLILLGLEAVARLGSGFLDRPHRKLSPEAIAHTLKFVDGDQKPYQSLDNSGALLARKSLATGYTLVGDQQSEFYRLNAQGYRDPDPLEIAKPNNEIRIFILGSSTAFSRGINNEEETIAALLEKRLQERVQQQIQSPGTYRPDVYPLFISARNELAGLPPKIRQGNYRVINVAVPGYSSGNELAQLALDILPYQPDVIVLLNGYEDLLLPSEQEATEIPKLGAFAQNPTASFGTYLKQSARSTVEKSALVRTVLGFLSPQNRSQRRALLSIRERNALSLAQQLPRSDEEFQGRLERYQQNVSQMLRLSSAARASLVVALQPEITGLPEERLDPTELEVRQNLDRAYAQQMTQLYPKMADTLQQMTQQFPNNMKFLNLYRPGEAFPSPAFVDPIHLNTAANQAIAIQLYNTITGIEKLHVIPENFYLD